LSERGQGGARRVPGYGGARCRRVHVRPEGTVPLFRGPIPTGVLVPATTRVRGSHGERTATASVGR